MPAFPPDCPPSIAAAGGSDVMPGQEVRDMDLSLDLSSSLFLPSLSLNEEETQQVDDGWSQDGDLQGCGQLERRWVLWHEFMKEHAHLDSWLRLAEQAASSFNPALVTYVTAKDELRKFERLRCEAGSRLVQLDSLTRRNRTLTRLFQGAMKARLLVSARECGQRWDDVNAKLESITERLKLFVSEWEEFEAEREELALWLADLDGRLTEVDHLTGNTCEKLRRLQSFQQCVCVNSGRVNTLLQRGEALIQRSQPADAQHVESRLLELLRRCSLVYNNVARTHTRLLSMRLVFEDDWILSQATDSGCPSESLLEDEGALDKSHLDPGRSVEPPSPVHLPPPPPSPSSPSHEHLGLEWDPSVDIGRSVSREDADSSYFSASTGLCHRDGVKRRSYLSSQSDITDENQEADLRSDGWLGHAHPGVFSPIESQRGGTQLHGDQWATSTPDGQEGEPVSFDGGRVRAWLGVQSPAPPERTTSCCKAVQTDGECHLDRSHITEPDTPQPRDLKASSDWMKHRFRSVLQADEEPSCCDQPERLLAEQSVSGASSSCSSSSSSSSSSLSPALLYLLLAAALVLLACLIWVALEPPCQRSSRLPRGFHLTLRYVSGPPPT
ncbi:nesprin-2 isoform X2 [Acanthopagrus latus]|uniref:nesprin-2 isoform X2 n=1 Tax=Acanthopagrus latus TaxID=8177 RepID=UPI00187C7AAD|nr:nesprin-2 isoform X2 [Acanthopagrus latus]